MLVAILLGAALVLVFALALLMTRQNPIRCSCGRPATRLASDGRYECDDCLERRLGGKVPVVRRKW